MLIVHSYDVSPTIIIPDCSASVLWSNVLFYGLDYRKNDLTITFTFQTSFN